MSSFHFCLSAAKNSSSFQLLPTSLVIELLQLVLGLPLFLFPWEFHSRAAFGTYPSSFLNVWPIHLNFLFLISKFISSWPVALHKSLLEIIFGHHILRIYLRHRFTKVCILRRISWIHFTIQKEGRIVELQTVLPFRGFKRVWNKNIKSNVTRTAAMFVWLVVRYTA